uniref:Chromosome 6 open reading frame 118 n=1 Tax=Pseudonaja textilis TaxID=8673 RepID=A0A670YJH3_PSETE
MLKCIFSFCGWLIIFFVCTEANMAERKQKYHLSELLDNMENAHKSEIRLYVSGHLNHNKLFKPTKPAKYNYWKSAKKATLLSAKKDALGGSQEMLEKFSSSKAVPPVPIRAKSASPLGYRSPVHPARFRAPVSVSLNTAAFKLQKKEAPEKPEDEASTFQKQLIREELDIPEMKLLKFRRLKNSRLCVTKEFEDEYRFLPSYLAGVTKKDQYNKFMQVQKEFIAKQDLLENDFIGSKSTERHEKKLAQALRNICDCRRPHFYRLQAIGQVFEDICNSSLIFGDILKEVKNEYELYMVILLDSLPAMQYGTNPSVKILVLSFLSAPAEKEEDGKVQVEATSMAHAELLTSLRCQIIMKCEEIQAIEKEIKNTMTFSGIINIKQKTVKELEVRHEVFKKISYYYHKSILQSFCKYNKKNTSLYIYYFLRIYIFHYHVLLSNH